MAEFGEGNGAVNNPPVAGTKPAPPGNNGIASMETHREQSVSNGNCGKIDTGTPVSGNMGAGKAQLKPLPRRSSIIKGGSRAGRERKKTVSFSHSLSEKKISSAADCISSMVEGSELRKVRSNTRVYQRYFLLEAGLQALRWEPTKKEPGKACLPVHAIREVRTGRNTETFRTSGVYEQISEDCAFSVVYGESYETLDLVANSAEVANVWVTGLRYLIQYGKHALDMIASSQDSLRLAWLREAFSAAAVEEEEGRCRGGEEAGLSLRSAVALIRGVNPGVRGAKAEHRFRELRRVAMATEDDVVAAATEDGSGAERHGHSRGEEEEEERKEEGEERVTRQEFIEVFHDLCTRPEIYFLLVQFSSNKEFLDTKDLMRFLEAEQGMTHVSEEASLRLIQSHEPSSEGRRRGWLSLDGFTAYLTSPDCHLFDGEHASTVCQDMTQPLSHYYVNSSHNTYLTEDQLRGPAHPTGYAHALRSGCRYVEVDVWDGPGGEPVVSAATPSPSATPTPPPPTLRSVLDAVARHAFAASEYPLVVCVESHCSPGQERAMVRQLVDALGERLYTGPASHAEGGGYLPSPHALRGRILLMGEKMAEGGAEDEGAETNGGGVAPPLSPPPPPPPSSPTQRPLLQALSDLLALSRLPPFSDFRTSALTQKPWEVCSLGEALAVRLAGERPGDFVNHNKRFLTRVSPAAARVDSSNLNPQDLWKCGCQMVGLNHQYPGLMMDLNTAWFRQNGGCGYVLRPAIMRQEVSYFSADTRDSVPGVSPQLLHVKVISGQNLPRPRGSGVKGDVVDPYVYVEIHGIPADCAERRTRTVAQSGDNAIFDESFDFQINLPELAMVRFTALDDFFIGDEFIGQYTIPLECVQPGFRHVPLQSLAGEELPHARLFVHVALTNRRGGGKPHKRGTSVRKARRGRDYPALRDLGVRAVDEVFKMAAAPLREAADLRENLQDSVSVFRELCGLSAVANLMQCVLALGSRMTGPDSAPLVLFDLEGPYPNMEPQGALPDVLRSAVASYKTMIQASCAVVELSDGVYDNILHIQTTAMEFHEKLPSMAAKEGLKGRKVSRAVESFSWNITILKGQADLLRRAKAEVQDNLKQVRYAALTSRLAKGGAGPEHRPRPRPGSLGGGAPEEGRPLD